MDQPRDVVITGVGVVSPIGIGRNAFWEGLLQGKSGVQRRDVFPDAADIPFQIGAPLAAEFDGKNFVQPRKSLKVMCLGIQAAYASANLAMQDAGLAKGAIDPDRFGVVLGSEMMYGDIAEVLDVFTHCVVDGKFVYEKWGENAFKDLFPLWMLKYLPNMAACHIGIVHDARGPTNSIVQGEVSSLLAVMESANVILRGTADVMLVGGCGSRLTTSALTFRRHDQMTRWNGDPTQASRPFDARHSGLVLGEGSGVLVLEAREHAQKRGANILATLKATSSRFESPQKPGGQTGTAIRASMESALVMGQISPQEVGFVKAHGDSVPEHDRLEAQAIQQLAGDVPVTSFKSNFGDLGAGSGAVELIGAVLSVANGVVPPTLNFESADPQCPVNVVRSEPLRLQKRTALAINQATTGHAAAVLLGPA